MDTFYCSHPYCDGRWACYYPGHFIQKAKNDEENILKTNYKNALEKHNMICPKSICLKPNCYLSLEDMQFMKKFLYDLEHLDKEFMNLYISLYKKK